MPKEDLALLLDWCLPFAHQQLQKNGQFFPFGATLDSNRKVVPSAPMMDNDHSASQEVVDAYNEIFTQLAQSKEAIATAICYDSRFSPDGDRRNLRDAIAVSLEHADGECLLVHEPYSKRFIGGYRFEPLVPAKGSARHFHNPSED